jgi:hypothetical protein
LRGDAEKRIGEVAGGAPEGSRGDQAGIAGRRQASHRLFRPRSQDGAIELQEEILQPENDELANSKVESGIVTAGIPARAQDPVEVGVGLQVWLPGAYELARPCVLLSQPIDNFPPEELLAPGPERKN